VIISADKLLECTIDLLIAAGESPVNAKLVADNLCKADARGVTTHGTYLLTPIFERVEQNQLTLPTRPKLAIDTAAVAVVQGGDGLGPVAGIFAANIAVDRAKQFGVSLVLIRDTNNLGSLAYYTEQIARQGMIAIMSCNAAPAMAPWGGAEAFTGTNPIAIAIYTGKELVFSADMATSVVARGKIRQAAREDKSIPTDWAMDEDGNPTTDPKVALKGTLLPMGGPKGSALALAVDIMSGMLSGAEYAPNVLSFHTPSGKTGVGAALIALDITKFMSLQEFESSMAEYVMNLKGMKKAKHTTEIFLPGEIEHNREVNSVTNGIKLDDKAVGVLNALLEKIGSTKRLNAVA
jgi:LDH2 family malate/lactate/ureidoglycolate dehydrogenase